MTIVISSGVSYAGENVSSGNPVVVRSGGIIELSTVLSGGLVTLSGGAAGGYLVVDKGGLVEGAGNLAGDNVVYGAISGVALVSAGFDRIESGGTANGVTVSGTGGPTYFEIDAGGSSTDAAVQSAADEIVGFGGAATGDVIQSGGVLFLQDGGTAVDVGIQSGGQFFYGGDVTGALTISSGGLKNAKTLDGVTVSSGGAFTLLGATLLSGATVSVAANATVSGVTVSKGAVVRGPGDLWGESLVAGSVSGVSLESETSLELLSGGVESGVTALDANIQIDAGASATGTVVSSGTSVRVYGSAADGVFTSAAAEFVYAGGVASGDSIQSGAKAIISSGGRAVGTTVSSGGIAYVFASGTAAGTVLSKGGKALVSSGGVTTATMVSSGGLAYVFAGGVASGDIVQDDGKELISSGGVASGATVQGGGAEYIYSSGGASGTLLSGGDAFVSSGGSLVSATTSAGGADYLRASGTATHTVVSAGGYELISSGGIASGTELLSGGKQYIYSSGTAVDATVSSGAREVISDGGVVSGLSLLSGGDLVDTGEVVISGAGTLAGRLSGLGAVIETGGGDLVLSDSGATFGGEAVVSGGTVELATAGALGNGDVTFVEPLTGSAVLQIDAADAPTAGGTFANTLFDFSGAHEDVVLTSIAYVTGATAAIVGSTLVLTDGANTYTFNVAGTTAVSYPVLDDNGVVEIDPRAISPKVIAFAHAAAAFAPSDAANTALVSSTSPTAHTPFLHATASAGAGHP